MGNSGIRPGRRPAESIPRNRSKESLAVDEFVQSPGLLGVSLEKKSLEITIQVLLVKDSNASFPANVTRQLFMIEVPAAPRPDEKNVRMAAREHARAGFEHTWRKARSRTLR